MAIVLSVLAVIVVIAAVVVTVVLVTGGDDEESAGGSAKATAEAFAKDVTNQDYASASKHVCAESKKLQKEIVDTDGTGTAPQVKIELTVDNVTVNGDRAEAQMTTRVSLGGSDSSPRASSVKVALKKDAGKWCILTFD
ncbi:hypothetical protein QSJ18_01570 [Gordonia sp. ABSL1-1]|uniref:Rv0361 family membrane protein n=1 Tax=Gordonia sp. ABSL1-1 TaxID=3053923 RepID=UPI0025727386|nr:hypothetical protein [Gordonia sp. ABSL1-1]MDL9935426.1 hypothetical protein [Gordonia sp. ABSL1-1]